MAGFSYNDPDLGLTSSDGKRYLYVKDGLGNISGIIKAESVGSVLALGKKSEIVCLYAYDAWGKCKVLNADGTENTSAAFIGNINPFRWKSRYLDRETGWYYVDGRYYDPAICQHIDADAPENLLLNSAVINGLNRYGITTDNAVALVGALYNIFTGTKLYTDPDYVAGFDWRIVLKIVITVGLILLSFAADPSGFMAANLVAMGFAISGAIIGGAIYSATGRNFWDGAAKGALIGYTVGMIVYSVVNIVRAVRATARAANMATVAESTKPSNTVAAETANAQPMKAPNETTKPVVENQKLQNIIDDLYHGINSPDKIGDGTTMDAIRYERATGLPVKGKFHTQKGTDSINGLNSLLNSNKLSSSDSLVAEKLLIDLYDAFNTPMFFG